MKIKIKTRMNQIAVVNQLWELGIIPNEQPLIMDALGRTKEIRVIASVAARLKKKFLKEAINREGQPGTKDFSLSFEYFECYYLEIIARLGAEKFNKHTYESSTLQNLADCLDEKLV